MFWASRSIEAARGLQRTGMITPMRPITPPRSTRFAPVERTRGPAAERPAPRRERPVRREGSASASTTPLLAGLVPNVAPRGERADLAARRGWTRAYAEASGVNPTSAPKIDVVV